MKRVMSVAAVLAFAAVSLTACKRQVTVRDANVYKNQTKYLQEVSNEQAKQLTKFVEAHCKCEGEGDAKAWTDPDCEEAAEILVIHEATVQYRVDMMMYLGSLTEERPPKEAPEIPPNTSICPE